MFSIAYDPRGIEYTQEREFETLGEMLEFARHLPQIGFESCHMACIGSHSYTVGSMHKSITDGQIHLNWRVPVTIDDPVITCDECGNELGTPGKCPRCGVEMYTIRNYGWDKHVEVMP